jgi:nucleoside-diphosphate-sugar epimerase
LSGNLSMSFTLLSAPDACGPVRFVYISSAGVTRPGRPGIILDEEPPAVRMNDMLGGILTYKLKAEDAIRVRESNRLWNIQFCAVVERLGDLGVYGKLM